MSDVPGGGSPAGGRAAPNPGTSTDIVITRRQMIIGGLAAVVGIAGTMLWWRWTRSTPNDNQIQRDPTPQRVSHSPMRSRPNSTERSRTKSAMRSRPSSTQRVRYFVPILRRHPMPRPSLIHSPPNFIQTRNQQVACLCCLCICMNPPSSPMLQPLPQSPQLCPV